MKIALAQINVTVADLQGNIKKILDNYRHACQEKAELVIFPELALTGYPPDDLQLRPDFTQATQEALHKLIEGSDAVPMVVGCPYFHEGELFNAAVIIQNQKILAWYAKHVLPNYGVFDEKRYYSVGTEACVFQVNAKSPRFGLLICEDTWFSEPAIQAKQAGAEILISIHASPFNIKKEDQREKAYRAVCQAANLPMLCCMLVGAQDDLCFDGGSRALNNAGDIVARAAFFQEQVLIVETSGLDIEPQFVPPIPSHVESVYEALTLGIKDYVTKNHFQGALLGLSGGIDSALTLTLAIDALGADKVTAVALPSRYTSELSTEALREQAILCNVKLEEISIEPLFNETLTSLKPIFNDLPADTTEENIQSRCRGILLMALSNKFRKIVLTTGNKSEMAMGYATLYGDMAGGFAALKDVPKTLVFELAKYRNSISYVIPEIIMTRPPSAELAPNQKDEDSLPPYEILDRILAAFIDEQRSIDEIVALGIDRSVVEKVIRLLFLNEYKRRQAPPGVKITQVSFTRDRRYPITAGKWWVKQLANGKLTPAHLELQNKQ